MNNQSLKHPMEWTLHQKPTFLCVGHYEIKPPIYEEITHKNNKCIRTNDKLESGLMHFN